ncbi:hypothetical protein ABPG77_009144 [Micractinium sp. CCAP 211/92]
MSPVSTLPLSSPTRAQAPASPAPHSAHRHATWAAAGAAVQRANRRLHTALRRHGSRAQAAAPDSGEDAGAAAVRLLRPEQQEVAQTEIEGTTEYDVSCSTAQADSSGGDEQAGLLGSRDLGEMLGFALPALGMVLADPLMSLIDTACVGRVSSIQLAALGPNTAIFNSAFQLFVFLGVGTTNIIATNSLRTPGLSSAELEVRRQAAEITLCNSLQLAVALGCLVAAVLLGCGRAFLSGMGVAPELLAPAWEYLSIRALAAPAVLLMSASQGACLGQQDAWTPFNVLLAAGALNTVGDVYLISSRGMGVAGAALATAAAQYLGAAYFLWHLWHKERRGEGIRLRWTGFPRIAQMREFLLVAATLFTRTVFGMAAYFSMTTAAARLGTLATATHQVAMQTFWFLSYFPEPLSLTAQSLLARDRGHPERAAHWAWLLLRSGAQLGLLLAAAVWLVFTRAASWFSADVAVQQQVARLAPVAMAAIAVCSGAHAAERGVGGWGGGGGGGGGGRARACVRGGCTSGCWQDVPLPHALPDGEVVLLLCSPVCCAAGGLCCGSLVFTCGSFLAAGSGRPRSDDDVRRDQRRRRQPGAPAAVKCGGFGRYACSAARWATSRAGPGRSVVRSGGLLRHTPGGAPAAVLLIRRRRVQRRG